MDNRRARPVAMTMPRPCAPPPQPPHPAASPSFSSPSACKDAAVVAIGNGTVSNATVGIANDGALVVLPLTWRPLHGAAGVVTGDTGANTALPPKPTFGKVLCSTEAVGVGAEPPTTPLLLTLPPNLTPTPTPTPLTVATQCDG
ncbi:hypothetical protein Vafri_3304 [Volvox africanus]|uniref:Uncharacterized protein n=1 Tax=Volvox africanus TaxID=51714 RepID=A0A8J4AS07_9CHLO|nr:hypothetical protein Vafri_3304 [Volvox africanus]